MTASALLRHGPSALTRPIGTIRLLGESVAMQALREQITRIAASEVKVLVTGESGTGKELVARALHAQSRRALNAFEPVNCAGVPETLLESELFGYAKGAFTGAYHDQIGKMEAAHMGTVFLDEVGEMSLRMQSLLLRFLETGEIQKVGVAQQGHIVDTRVIAATNRYLPGLIDEKQFRADLYYRLNVVRVVVPPVRERRQDIPELLAHYLAHFAGINRSQVARIHPDAQRLLVAYDWPGNVRELENVVEGFTVLVPHDEVVVSDLPPEVRAGGPRPARTSSASTDPAPTLDAADLDSGTVPTLDSLYARMRDNGDSFWAAVYPAFMIRDLTRHDLRTIVRRALREAQGNYRVVTRLFNLEPADYKRFMNFLRQHGCLVPFREYR